MNLRSVSMLMTATAAILIVVSMLLPWMYYEKGTVHIRYSATGMRVCAGGEFCRSLEWKSIGYLPIQIRDVVELAENVTGLDTIDRYTATSGHLDVKVPKHPVDIVYTVLTGALALSASMMPIKNDAIRRAVVTMAAVLSIVAVFSVIGQLFSYSTKFGAGAATSIAAVAISSISAVIHWRI